MTYPMQIVMIMRELKSELKTSERRARYYELRSTTSTPTMLSELGTFAMFWGLKIHSITETDIL